MPWFFYDSRKIIRNFRLCSRRGVPLLSGLDRFELLEILSVRHVRHKLRSPVQMPERRHLPSDRRRLSLQTGLHRSHVFRRWVAISPSVRTEETHGNLIYFCIIFFLQCVPTNITATIAWAYATVPVKSSYVTPLTVACADRVTQVSYTRHLFNTGPNEISTIVFFPLTELWGKKKKKK